MTMAQHLDGEHLMVMMMVGVGVCSGRWFEGNVLPQGCFSMRNILVGSVAVILSVADSNKGLPHQLLVQRGVEAAHSFGSAPPSHLQTANWRHLPRCSPCVTSPAYVLRKTASVETADRAMAAIIKAITSCVATQPEVALFAKVGRACWVMASTSGVKLGELPCACLVFTSLVFSVLTCCFSLLLGFDILQNHDPPLKSHTM